MLKLSNLSVQIAGVDILRDVTMAVPPKSFAALVGRNGAGKTTLMRSIINLLPNRAGEIHIDGLNTTKALPHQHARNGVGYMPEDRRLVPDWTVEKNILLPTWASSKGNDLGKLDRIYSLIPEVAQFRERRALQLSGGQQKLVALARALMASNKLLILDEPFEGVAPALVQRLIEILSNMRKESTLSVLISESDAVHSAGLVDLSYAIERGRVEPSSSYRACKLP